MPAFAYRHVKDLYPVFWSKSCELVTAIISTVQDASSSSTEEKVTMPCSVIEIGGWASRATLDIIGVAGMGQSFNAIQDPNAELNLTYRKVFVRGSQAQILGYLGFVLPFWFLRRIPVQRNFDVFRAVNVIKKVCRQLIQQKQRKLDQKEKTEVDILSVALESGGFSQENLVDQMMTFLAAGHETTASATIWAVYLLCQNPEVQTKLREEVRRNLPSANDTSTVATSEMLGRMPYLHAVCNEVLRVYAPVPLTLREAAKDTSILGQFIPKGTRVIMAPWAVNMSTEFWGEDAGKFDPERWMRPGMANSGGAESNYSFLTFLHGPRSCIGQTFAKAELACLVASLVGRFEMELNDKDAVIEIKEGITAKPKDGLNVRMKVLEGW
ncbi:hypothetical protein MMC12_005386 [Toensbergia leucococca]|nr:hypothetical protein [Toensbergia leucococca]